jgi:diacylglycerol kinase (ATP)
LIQVFAETDATLAVIPAGTGNDLVFGLDLPVALRTSVEAALKPAEEVDVLKFESDHGQPKYGATIATAGFSAAVNVRAESMSWPRGASRYTVATLRQLAGLKRYDLELTIDGVEIDGRCLMIAIANTRAFGGGMQIAPEADPDDGLADVVIIRDSSALTLLRMLPKTFSGGHLNHPAVETFRGNQVTLSMKESDSGNNCCLRSDGEDVGSLPQTVTVVRGGLRVAGVPPSAPDTDEGKEIC